jgi:hypothetical protein
MQSTTSACRATPSAMVQTSRLLDLPGGKWLVLAIEISRQLLTLCHKTAEPNLLIRYLRLDPGRSAGRTAHQADAFEILHTPKCRLGWFAAQLLGPDTSL